MIDACQNCQWGPNGSRQCEYYHLPAALIGESCQWWDLFRRFGGNEDERDAEGPRTD